MNPLDLARQVLSRGHEGTEAHTLARALVVSDAQMRRWRAERFVDDWHRWVRHYARTGQEDSAIVARHNALEAERELDEALADLRSMGEKP